MLFSRVVTCNIRCTVFMKESNKLAGDSIYIESVNLLTQNIYVGLRRCAEQPWNHIWGEFVRVLVTGSAKEFELEP